MAFCSRKLLLFLVTPFIFLFTQVCGQITVRPRNTWTFIGERTVLECCSHDKSAAFIWKKYLEVGRAPRICNRGDDCPYDANYIIEKSTPGCNNLTIVSTSSHDSTYFECTIDGTDDKSAAFVIPYSCHPDKSERSDFVEGDVVTFRCEVICQDKLQFFSYWMNEQGKIIKWNNFTGGSCVSTWIVSLQRPELKAYAWVLQFLMDPSLDDQFDKTNTNMTWTSKKEPVDYPVTINPIPNYIWLDKDGKEVGRDLTLKLSSTGQRMYKCVAANTTREIQHNDSVSAEETWILIYLKVILAFVLVIAIAVLPSCLLNLPPLIIKAKQLYNCFWKDSQQPASREEREICLRDIDQMGIMVRDGGLFSEQREPCNDGLVEHREQDGNCTPKNGGAHPDDDDGKASTVVDMPRSEATDN